MKEKIFADRHASQILSTIKIGNKIIITFLKGEKIFQKINNEDWKDITPTI